jgi:hypothetical protein
MAKAKLEFNIGANNTEAKRKIQEVKKEGISVTQEIQNKNREGIKNFLGMFAPIQIGINLLMSALSAVGESIRKHFNAGQVFVDWGKKANISAQSVAYLKAQADSAGISAKEFETAMDDLNAGRTTVEKLRKEWQGLGDDIKTATNAQQNFSELSRKRNFGQFGEGASSFLGGIAEGALEMVGFGGAQLSTIERMAYQGASYEDALFEAKKARRGWHAPITESRLKEAYYTARANMFADEMETKKRNIDYTAKQLYKADLSASEREAIFEEQTGQRFTNEAILKLGKSLLSRDELLAERIKEGAEATKAEKENERNQDGLTKKEEEAKKKFAEDLDKIGTSLKETFVDGGGLIAGVNYNMRYNNTMEELAILRQQLQAELDSKKTLSEIEKTLKGDE